MARKRIYTPEEIREHKRLRGIEYRKRNAEKIRAYRQRPEVKARHKAQCRKWREDNPDYQREYYAAHRTAFREYHYKWLERKGRKPRIVLTEEERTARTKARKLRQHVRHIVRSMLDCDYYAECRRKDRERANRRRLRMGLTAAGQPARRIPDWCVRGGVLDCRSQWLWENVTDEQKAYAKELFIERKERRRAM